MKKLVSFILLLAITMLGTNVFAEESYKTSDWAKEEIALAEQKNLIPETLISEDLTKDITRLEFAAVSVKLFESISGETAEPIKENPFEDTGDEYVLKAYNLGITTGTSETLFSPDEPLNREQAAVMLSRVYKKVAFKEWTIEKDADFSLEFEQGEKFADDEYISDWAKESVYFMVANGVLKGVGENKFAPKNIKEEEIMSGYANASREQAIITAARITKLEKPKKNEGDPSGLEVDPYRDEREKPEETEDENTYTVAFIGGSLTQGGTGWIATTKSVLQKHMPDKKIVTINAGKGGTGSAYGAARFMEDVGIYNPDMIFIEFAVNDCGTTEEGHKVYMESMVRQAKKLAKEPTIIFLNAPHPVEEDSETFKKCEAAVRYKTQVADHYGIKTINVYDYMQRDYAKTKEEKGYETFTDYLATMYAKSGDGFNVHGGYDKYGEAITEAFETDYEGCMAKPKDAGVYYTAKKSLVEASYNHIYINSGRMNYTGPWQTYTYEKQFETEDPKATINSSNYKYPYFPAGIKQVMNDTAAFGFMTKAEAFCVNYSASSAGSAAKVYIDGKESGSVSCYSQYHAMNYTSNWISLPNDGKEHKVILVVDRPSSENYVFRFGSVIERTIK